MPSGGFDGNRLEERGIFVPELSLLSSVLFTAFILGISAAHFRKTDY